MISETGNPEQRFQVLEEKFGTHSAFLLKDILTGEYARILPNLGGTINNLCLKHKDRLYNILEGYTSSDDADENLSTSFKGSNLFPFPNRVRDGRYLHNGKKYQLELNFPHENNAIHGLIYNKNFEIIKKENGYNSCSLSILYRPNEPLAGYPFDYTFEIEYHWDKHTLFKCISRVKNNHKDQIPVGIGWHPYFRAGDDKIDDLFVQFPAERILQVDKRQIPTGKANTYSAFNNLTRINETILDSCFVLKKYCLPAEIVIFNKKENFGYKIWQEVGEGKYNFLQVYTPPSRKSIAFEPMTCAPDALNNKEGLIMLAPGNSICVKWGVSALDFAVSPSVLSVTQNAELH
jgi:aldose 1-epimerase